MRDGDPRILRATRYRCAAGSAASGTNKNMEEKQMKKTFAKVEYDTDTATLIKKVTSGSIGDPAGYEVSLYQTPEGKYFQYTNGGDQSPYAKEAIKRVSAASAKEWLEANA